MPVSDRRSERGEASESPPTRAVPAARTSPEPCAYPIGLEPAVVPTYFGPTPHYATSPLPRRDGRGRVVPGTGMRKFVDRLPGLGPQGRNELGNFLPIATPDTITYPGCDYYEIGVLEYVQRLHSDLPPTWLRGYRQLNMGTDTDGHNTVPPPDRPYHGGPVIRARRGRPVRVKFVNQLPTGQAGELFLPVDASPDAPPYPQNRAVLHLRGAVTGWISAGNPNQWITPAGERTPYPTGVGVVNVPDMPPPGAGAVTLYFPNQQSGRLLWFHDNSVGLSRLTVYSGQLGLYLLTDPVEEELVTDGVLPAEQIPLVIEDKIFVPDDEQLAAQDPTWDRDRWGARGSLWFPHVYLPNQNPHHASGRNPFGRWDYGPWCRGTQPRYGPVANPHHDPVGFPDESPLIPGTPHPSSVPEMFGDTPLVNGCAFPYLEVEPKAYRFRILNACTDRSLNLQLYRAATAGPMWRPDGSLRDAEAGEVPMVPAVPTPDHPPGWPTDGRLGGVPDPNARGPVMIQIGSECGLLPAPVMLASQPIDYSYDRRKTEVLNPIRYTLLLAPGERADVIIDFAEVAPGTNLILYNDAPAPLPAFDPRYDHNSGGGPSKLAGYGPNTRTLLQLRVVAGTPAQPFDLAALADRLPKAYARSQRPPIVAQPAYDAALGSRTPGANHVTIEATHVRYLPTGAATPAAMPLAHKVIEPSFDPDHGRAGARFGVMMPHPAAPTTVVLPLSANDPPTEVLFPADDRLPGGASSDGTQLWRISNRTRYTQPLRFPFDVQLVNRVGWDGSIHPPEPNELGWKETLRVNPGQDVIVALRPVLPVLPFTLGDSVRLLDPAQPAGTSVGFTSINPADGRPAVVANQPRHFGWEYRWHGQLTGHPGNEPSRPLVLRVCPAAPSGLTATGLPGSATALPAVALTWTNQRSRPAATRRVLQRATDASFQQGLTSFTVAVGVTRYTDTTIVPGVRYHYRVRAENAAGHSGWSNSAPVTVELPCPVRLAAVVPPNTPLRVGLSWTNRSFATGVEVQRATNPTFTSGPVTISGPVGSSYLDSRISSGTTYFYRVRTTYLDGASAWSPVATVTTPAVPATPTGVSATMNRSAPQAVTVTLRWDAEPTGAGGGFVVQRSADARFTQEAVSFTVAGRGFTNTGLPPGRTYHYRVRAFTVAGASPYTAALVVTTPG